MNKTEIVDVVAKNVGITKAQATKAIDAFVTIVTNTLAKGGKVTLIGFGTFSTRKRAARTGSHPRIKGEKIKIPASTTPAFKAGKKLKDAVNKKKVKK